MLWADVDGTREIRATHSDGHMHDSDTRATAPGAAASARPERPALTPRLRVLFAHGRKIGPGKADLLDAIGRTGSISAAGREMGMSYRRAWLLVDEINRIFTEPLVVATTGGPHGGGAQLTDFGRAVLAAFRRIEARTSKAIAEELAPFTARLSGE